VTEWVPALVGGLLAAAGGVAAPALVRSVPEPDDPAEGKEAYTALAGRPGLAVLVAALALVAGALVGASLGWAWPLVYLLPLVPLAVVLAWIDWRTLLLPKRLVWPAYAVVTAGLLVCLVATREVDDLLRALAGFGVWFGYFGITWFVSPRVMGFGDVRFSGVLGLALGQLGWAEVLVGLVSSFLLLGVVGGLLIVLRVIDRSGNPFGPFMGLGALVGIAWGEPLLSAFLGGR
jgi:leader peptidase (prepilin peptidase)/N-methyltransferase